VREALGGLPAVNVDLDQLRSGEWTALLASPKPHVVICDAEAAEDLDAIIDGAGRGEVLLAGSSDLVRRWLGAFEGLAPSSSAKLPAGVAGSAPRVLGVIGSTAATIAPQLAHAVDRAGVVVRQLEVADLLAGEDRFLGRAAAELRQTLVRNDVCLVPGPSPALDREQQRRVASSLAEVVARAVGATDRTALFLTGGETARAVLDRLATRCLAVDAEVHHGAVLSHTESGRLVATRPGSFGHEASITDIFQALRGAQATYGRTTHDGDH
jgi:4-hydroxythreonine-4-phosphate dehydrogenase